MKKVCLNSRGLVIASMLAVLGLFAVSCSDDDNEGETLAPLTGKWSISKIGTTTSGGEVLVDAPQNQSGCEKDFMDLKTDNTVQLGNYDSSIDPCALFTDQGIYSRSHNNLTRVIDGVTKTQDIVNLTLNELKLKDVNGNIELYIK